MTLKIIQINVHRRVAAHHLLSKVADEKDIDLALVQEPNSRLTSNNPKWIVDCSGCAAVFCVNPRCGIVSHSFGPGYVLIKFDSFTIFSCYVSPNTSLENYKTYVDTIMQLVVEEKTEVVVAGDFNAKSAMWNSASSDDRGVHLVEWIQDLYLVVNNEGDTPTFTRGPQRTIIGITFSTQVLNRQRQEESKHKWQEKASIDELAFRSTIQLLQNSIDDVEDLTRIVKSAQLSCTRKSKEGTNRAQPVWWNENIAQLREKCNKSRRNITRARVRPVDPVSISVLENKYKDYRKFLRKAIRESQRAQWNLLCERVEEDPWGQGYQIVIGSMRHLKMPYVLHQKTKEEKIIELFPRDDTPNRYRYIEYEPPMAFTEEELKAAVSNIKVRKAAGPDGILPVAVKIAADTYPEVFLRVMNDLLRDCLFPERWKIAKVILISEGNTADQRSKVRPICLIDIIDKLYEYLLKGRLETELTEKNGISEIQFGFRPKKSTVHAGGQ
ncbi:uncharacterized protein [Leptinotarsa decemlineata]|uniref:uncharacterized protein n=1 Tax=Leptinotarsa decemlineata TaxID=7539 RepID=UPI003D30571E